MVTGAWQRPVSTAMKIKICGRDSSCELVLEDPTVSAIHARIELADDGKVWLHDADSASGTFLYRNDNWIRVKKVTLCIGDRIRLGDYEIPLDQLVSLFGQQSNARLEARHFALKHGNIRAKLLEQQLDHKPKMNKPRRNPTTGKIEEKGPQGTR